jgi:hypothetical protein
MKKLLKSIKIPFRKEIKFEYNSILNSIAFWINKREADKRHKSNGRRYHVVPATSTRLIVVDNSYIKHYNKHSKGPKLTIVKLLEMSYYSTPVQGITRTKKAKK